MSEGRCESGFHLIAAFEKSWAWEGRGERWEKMTIKIRTGSRERKDPNFIVVHIESIFLKVNKFREEEFASVDSKAGLHLLQLAIGQINAEL